MSRKSNDGGYQNLTRGNSEHVPAVVSKITYKEVRADVLEDVYEPAEDTFLLADCAVDAASLLFPLEVAENPENEDSGFSKSGDFFVRGLEIGCGSGFVSLFLHSKVPSVHMIGVDINPNAVLCSRQNGVCAYPSDMFEIFEQNRRIQSFASSLPDHLPTVPVGGFDLILFNPPYLPTAADERVPGYLNYAFDGGIFGRDSIDRFLEEVGDYLSDFGFFLLLISSLTGLNEVTAEMQKNGFSAEVVGRTKVSFEELFVLKGKRL